MIVLGKLGKTARLSLNGIDCGARIAPPYAFDITSAFRKGENVIEAEAVNNPVYKERDSFSSNVKLPPRGIMGHLKFLKK